MSSRAVESLDEQTFDAAVRAATKTLVVDFWAPWCGPCRMMEGPFASLAEESSEQAHFAKVNVDNSPDLASRFRIRSIPTVLVFREGRVIKSAVGAQTLESLRDLVA